MNLPFTVEQFLYVFGRYNMAVAPAQWLLYAFGFAAVGCAVRPARLSAKLICLILSLFWASHRAMVTCTPLSKLLALLL